MGGGELGGQVVLHGLLRAGVGQLPHSVTHYDLVLSPRADNLVLITPTPSNVLQYLVPRGRPMGLPGLRLEKNNGGLVPAAACRHWCTDDGH